MFFLYFCRTKKILSTMENADVLTIEDLTVGFRHDGSLHDEILMMKVL